MSVKGAEFAGLSVAIVTPFKNGEVDYEKLKAQVNFQIDAGTTCLCPVGTTGESPTLTHEEHERVISAVVETAAGRIKVMAGTGSNSTAEALRLTRWAKKAGADAALVVAQDRLSQSDEALADEGYAYLEQALAAGLDPAITEAAARLVALPKDSPRAASLLEGMTKAADAGAVTAMWALADIYAFGGPVPADSERSLAYLRAAADAGHLEAQLRLGLQYAQQKADPEQVELARHYLEAAAKQGSAPAKTYLAAL